MSEKVSKYLKDIEEKKDLNIFLSLNENVLKDVESAKGELKGTVYGVKSNISVKGLPVNCGSKVLDNYIGSFDADVITKLKEKGSTVLGMVNCDEFASGSTGENSAFGPTKNPVNTSYVTGGSSSGSAACVAADLCDFSLGSDTGGSVRNPASHCGIVGLKPSYGLVSRYGLIDLSMSLEGIGIFSKDVKTCAKVLSVIAGESERDATTSNVKSEDYVSSLTDFKNKKIGVIKEVEKLCTNKEVFKTVMDSINDFAKKNSCEVVEVSIKNLDLAVKAYYPIVYTEFFSGTRKFDGRKYGKKIEDFCGEEVLRRILGGKEISKSEYDGKYYKKALAVKDVISKEFENCFKEVDIICSPVTPDVAKKLGEKTSIEEEYAGDIFTCPVNLSGDCAGVVNCGEVSGLPVGLQFISQKFKESILLSAMNSFEEFKK